MSARICRYCGTKPSKDKAKFCGSCGKLLESLPSASAASPLPTPALPARRARRWLQVSKPTWFGINGALGCFLGALLGEIILALLLPPPPPPPPRVDIAFVLDVTGSMEEEINGVRDGISKFAEQFSSRGLDTRVGLVAFGDRSNGEEPVVLRFDGDPFTPSAADFSRELSRVDMVHGGDAPESSLDALSLTARQPFRPEAKKIIVFVSDAPPKVPDKEIANPDEVITVLQQNKIDQLHLVVQEEDYPWFSTLQTTAPGKYFRLSEVAGEREGFNRLLPEIGASIAGSISGVASSRQFSEQEFWQVTAAYALWTSLLAVGVALSLIIGQNYYGHKPLLTARQLLSGTVGSGFVGLVAGGAGQILFAQGTGGFIARFITWGILGGLLGWGVAAFVPNLRRAQATWGGALGGTLGAVAFLVLAALIGDLGGRLLGAAILGLCIGLMIAIVEATFRKVWLEVAGGSKEKWTVTLGETPIRVGSNELSEIYVPGVEPEAFRYRVEQGKVMCELGERGQTSEVPLGDQKTVGALKITVCGS